MDPSLTTTVVIPCPAHPACPGAPVDGVGLAYACGCGRDADDCLRAGWALVDGNYIDPDGLVVQADIVEDPPTIGLSPLDGRPPEPIPATGDVHEQVYADGAPEPPASRASALDDALAPQLGLDLGLGHTKRADAKLTDRFVVPPFTTLDTRADYWKERKRLWLGLGIQSELGRAGALAYQTDTVVDPQFYDKKQRAEAQAGRPLTIDEFRRDYYVLPDYRPNSVQATGTSIFDPVLAEIMLRWYSPAGGVVLDPFAGGSVRGVVASILGRDYFGVELRPEQVEANRVEAARLVGPDSAYDFGGRTPLPRWTVGSAIDLPAILAPRTGITPADMVLTCPPYADLEVYSDDPRDLSTMGYPAFRALLAGAMAHAVAALRDDRFMVWVVGEARHPKTGMSYGIIADTVRAAHDAGAHLYNEAILMTPIGSGAMRATKQVMTSRKLVRVHQHVLVFVKGDPRRAADACGDPTEVA
jgi:hypothetical protein